METKEEETLKEIVIKNGKEHTNKVTMKQMIEMLMNRTEIDDFEIADLLIYLISNYGWKLSEIMEAIKENIASVNWLKIYEYLDNEKTKIDDIETYYRILESWSCINGDNTFPFKFFFGKWKNVEIQIKFLEFLMHSNPQITNLYNNIFITRIMTIEEGKNLKMAVESNYNCLELFKTMKDLNLINFIDKLKTISLEWTILGLTFVHPFCSDVHESLLRIACKMNNPIINIIFKKNQKLILSKLEKILDDDLTINKLLDVILEQKLLPYICDIPIPIFFCFELVILSCRRDHINLNIWISNCYTKRKENFIISLINYLSEKFNRPVIQSDFKDKQYDTFYFPLTHEITYNILQTLDLLISSLSKETQILFTKLKNNLPVHIKDITLGKNNLEIQSNEFISDLINEKKSVQDALEELSKLLNGNIHDRELVMKIFTLLVENYPNFYKLSNMALASLYGKLIQKNIFPNFYLQKALNSIIFSLNSLDDKEFNFGIKCIEEFIDSIYDYPAFYNEIEKIETVKILLNNKKNNFLLEEDNVPIINNDIFFIVDLPKIEKNRKKIQNRFSFEESYLQSTTTPNIHQDKDEIEYIYFSTEDYNIDYKEFTIENNFNLTNENFTTLYQDFSEKIRKNLIVPEYLARYFFENKILESNTHNIYIRFYLNIDNDFFYYLNEEIFNILRKLLHVKLDKAFEIKYLKCLGEFSGKLNIARDKIFTLEQFNLNEYIIKSIEKKRIGIAIYFLVNFLKQSKNSMILKPKNPYIMNLLEIMNELYDYLSLSLREEVDKLYKELNIKLNNLGIRNKYQKEYLLNCKTMHLRDALKNINFNNSLSYLADYKIDQKNILKHVISMALDFSIREIAFPLAHRTTVIALKTTQSIFKNIMKKNTVKNKLPTTQNKLINGKFEDTIYIDPENQFKNMLAHLIQSLITVTAPEPIRASICGNLPYFLKMAGLDINMSEISKIAEENVEICIKIIKDVSLTKSIENLKEIKSEYKIPIINEAIKFNTLRIQPIKNTEYQEIKEKLSKFRKDVTNHIDSEWNILKDLLDFPIKFISQVKNILKRLDQNVDECVEVFCQKVIAFIIQESENCNGCTVCKDILYLKNLDLNDTKNEIEENSPVQITIQSKRIELLAYFLIKLFKKSLKTCTDVTNWVIYGTGDLNYNIQILCIFIKYRLINIHELDQRLSKIENTESNINNILYIITHLVLGYVTTPFDFISTIEYLNKINNEKYDLRIHSLLSKIQEIVMFKKNNLKNKEIYEKNIKESKFYNERLENNKDLLFNNTFELAFDHYIKYSYVPSNYQFLEVDKINDTLINSLEIFYSHLSAKNYIFMNFYCRFVENYLDLAKKKKIENYDDIYNLLLTISPRNIPSFTILYLKICSHPFIEENILKGQNGLNILKEIIFILDYIEERHSLILNKIYKFFKKLENKEILKENASYLNLLINRKFMILKNLFNKIKIIKNQEIDLSTPKSAYYTIPLYLQEINNEKIQIFKKNPKNYILNALIENAHLENAKKIIIEILNENKIVFNEVVYRGCCWEGEVYMDILKKVGVCLNNDVMVVQMDGD